MKRTHSFMADDGAVFTTAEACKNYEEQESFNLLVGMSGEDVREALDRSNIKLSNAVEHAGNIVAAKRRADGGLKRRKKKPVDEAPTEEGAPPKKRKKAA